MPTPPVLTLRSADLLSTWGFGDGDEPNDLLDWWADHEPDVDYPTLDWHAVLRKLVREHLVPAISRFHDIEVHDIDTHHSPIRALMVDGREVQYPDDVAIELRPEQVVVPYATVMDAVRAVGLRRSPESP